jgi:glycerol-3-phosphate dehydrogenase (NAD(P)+)
VSALGAAVSVLGAGAWGTVLAGLAAENGSSVTLWARRGESADRLNRERMHPALPGVSLHPGIVATDDLGAAARAATIAVAVPAQAVRSVCEAIAPLLSGPVPLVIAAKGLEQASGLLMHEVARAAIAGARPLILSGPGFASEVGVGLPAAVTLAAGEEALAARTAALFARPTFRPYLSDDLTGVAVGGAVKNVLAIASGIVIGRGLGESARAGLIARGVAELSRFGTALGARPQTMSGLSGLGDLVLTATSTRSRNLRFGVALGEGRTVADLTAPGAALAEGYFSAPAVVARARRHGVDMPLAQAVADILSGQVTIDDAIASLLDRPLTVE